MLPRGSFKIILRESLFNMEKKIRLTDEGLKKLQDELENLKTKGRAEIAEKIKEARSYGDLSEKSRQKSKPELLSLKLCLKTLKL